MNRAEPLGHWESSQSLDVHPPAPLAGCVPSKPAPTAGESPRAKGCASSSLLGQSEEQACLTEYVYFLLFFSPCGFGYCKHRSQSHRAPEFLWDTELLLHSQLIPKAQRRFLWLGKDLLAGKDCPRQPGAVLTEHVGQSCTEHVGGTWELARSPAPPAAWTLDTNPLSLLP